MNDLRFPATVRQLARQLGVDRSTVLRWIERGHFETEKSEKGPLLVISGERPMSAEEWRKEAAARARDLRPGTWGFDTDSNDLCILRGTSIQRVAFVSRRRLALAAISSIAS